MENMFWIIESATESAAELNIAFTGTADEVRAEAHRHHRGATIHRADLFDGKVTA